MEEREKDAAPKEEYWDAPEAQTEPGNSLTWDDMIPKDQDVQPVWVEEQERELMEWSLPWQQDPKGTWFRDQSPRWRIWDECVWALSPNKNRINKYKLVMGPESAWPGQDVYQRYSELEERDKEEARES